MIGLDPMSWAMAMATIATVLFCVVPGVVVCMPVLSILYFLVALHKSQKLKFTGIPPVPELLRTYFSDPRNPYEGAPSFSFKGKEWVRIRVHLASLATVLYLWDKRHYRHESFQRDMILNLRNVAIPGTGVPLSLFSRSSVATLGVIVIIAYRNQSKHYLQRYPIVALLGAIRGAAGSEPSLGKSFASLLLRPTDWFSLWRLNCRLAALHFLRTKDKGYLLEDKWRFLQRAKEEGIPVTPWLDDAMMVVKHKNEEGGLGFYRYKNVTAGGRPYYHELSCTAASVYSVYHTLLITNLSDGFSVQIVSSNLPMHSMTAPQLHGFNATVATTTLTSLLLLHTGTIRKLLPTNAPLSTFRVLTASTHGLEGLPRRRSGTSNATTGKEQVGGGRTNNESKAKQRKKNTSSTVKTLTVVWRAGRSGAATDHNSVLFDVQQDSGKILRGTTNQHWYQLGGSKILTTSWTQDLRYLHHPDTGVAVTGKVLPEIKKILDVAERAHSELVPGVPLVGWDVAMTEKHGILLLEGNFSCNFFMGTVDYDWYYKFCDDFYRALW
eukprot:jgi/Bigna1/87251/estExt_fgenesh1_pg.C_180084